MDYLTVGQAKEEPGLRLVLTRDVPGPWSEAAKAVLRWHNVDLQSRRADRRTGQCGTRRMDRSQECSDCLVQR